MQRGEKDAVMGQQVCQSEPNPGAANVIGNFMGGCPAFRGVMSRPVTYLIEERKRKIIIALLQGKKRYRG
jgi:hypothetical protein